MRKSIVALVTLTVSSPALAANPYVGFEIGLSRGKSNDVDETVRYRTTSGAISDPLIYDDVFGVVYKRGIDADLLAGYDLGWLRIEGELAEKRVKLTRNVNDDITDEFLAELNAGLNRPSKAPDPGAPGRPALTIADFQPSGTLKAASAMLNVLIEVTPIDRFSVYAGAGVGRSFVRRMGDADGALAYQKIAGARYAINDRLEIGLKYKKFNSGIIRVDDNPIEYPGNPDQQGESVQTTNAAVTPDIEGEFRTKSLLVSFVYNLR
jgi:opacity protein-like surface antigen